MALVIKDRVKETTTTTGTGTLTLAGAFAGFDSFAEIGNGNTTYYSCTDGTDFEVGIGTYTASGTTLSRDTIFESSGATATADVNGATTAATGVAVDSDGSVYVTGVFAGALDFGGGNLNVGGGIDQHAFLIKLDSSGNHVWSKDYGSTTNDKPFAITLDPTGFVLVTGYITGTGGVDFGGGVQSAR